MQVVAKKASGAIVSGHQKIEVAVAVEIAETEASADTRLTETSADFSGDVVKNTGAVVQKKLRRWGDRSIFPRAPGRKAIFIAPPGRAALSDEFIRNYQRYADQLFTDGKPMPACAATS